MKKLLINALMMVVLMGVSKLAVADNGETCKCTNTKSVSKQVRQIMEDATASIDNPQGAVMVEYSIDANNNIHVEATQSNSDVLSEFVKNHLEGQSIHMNGSQCTHGYLKVNFTSASTDGAKYDYIMY